MTTGERHGTGRAHALGGHPASGGRRTRGRFLRARPPGRTGLLRTLLLLGSLLIIVLATGTLLGDSGLPTYRRLTCERAELEAEVERLRQEDARLQDQIEALRNDPAALERFARERYRMRRPDERLIEVVGGFESNLTTRDRGAEASMGPPAAAPRTLPTPGEQHPPDEPAAYRQP